MFVLGLRNGSLSLVDEENDIQCWRRRQYEVPIPTTGVFRVPTRGVSVACSPDGSCIASVDRSSTNFKIWNLDGTTKSILCGNIGDLESITFSPRGTLLAILSFDGRIQVYNTKKHGMLWHDKTPFGAYSVSFSGDSKFVAAAAKDGSAWIWGAATGKIFKKMFMGGVGEFCPTDSNLFATTDGDDLSLWNIETEEAIWNVVHGRDDYLDIQNFAHFSPDGKMIATVQQDRIPDAEDPESDIEEELSEDPNYVVVVHAANGKTKFSLEHERWSSVYEAAFSPDGRHLACVGDKGEVHGLCVLWNTSDGNATCKIIVGCPIRSIAWVYKYSEMRRESLAMVKHDRLGADSELRVLDEEILRMIAHFHEFPTKPPEHFREFRILPWDGN